MSVAEAIAAGLDVGLIPLFLAKGWSNLIQLSDPLDECETQLWLLWHPERGISAESQWSTRIWPNSLRWPGGARSQASLRYGTTLRGNGSRMRVLSRYRSRGLPAQTTVVSTALLFVQ